MWFFHCVVLPIQHVILGSVWHRAHYVKGGIDSGPWQPVILPTMRDGVLGANAGKYGWVYVWRNMYYIIVNSGPSISCA